MSSSPVPRVDFFHFLAAEAAIGVVIDDGTVFFRQLVGIHRNAETLLDLPVRCPTREIAMEILRPIMMYNDFGLMYDADNLRLIRVDVGTQGSGFTARSTFEHSVGLRYLLDNGVWYFSHAPYVHHVPFAEAMDDAICFDIILSEKSDGRWHVSPDVLHARSGISGMPTWKKFRKFLVDNEVQVPDFPTNNPSDQIYVGEDVAGYIRLAYPKTHVWV